MNSRVCFLLGVCVVTLALAAAVKDDDVDPCKGFTHLRIVNINPGYSLGSVYTTINITVCNLDLNPDTMTTVTIADTPCSVQPFIAEDGILPCEFQALPTTPRGTSAVTLTQNGESGVVEDSVPYSFVVFKPEPLRIVPDNHPVNVGGTIRIDTNDFVRVVNLTVKINGINADILSTSASEYVLVRAPTTGEAGSSGPVEFWYHPSTKEGEEPLPPVLISASTFNFTFSEASTDPLITIVTPEFMQRTAPEQSHGNRIRHVTVHGAYFNDVTKILVGGLTCENFVMNTAKTIVQCDAPVCETEECFNTKTIQLIATPPEGDPRVVAQAPFAFEQDMVFGPLQPFNAMPANFFKQKYTVRVDNFVNKVPEHRLWLEVAGMEAPVQTYNEETKTITFLVPRCTDDLCEGLPSGNLSIRNTWDHNVSISQDVFTYLPPLTEPEIVFPYSNVELGETMHVTGDWFINWGIHSATVVDGTGKAVAAATVNVIDKKNLKMQVKCRDTFDDDTTLPVCASGKFNINIYDKRKTLLTTKPYPFILNSASVALGTFYFSNDYETLDKTLFSEAIREAISKVAQVDKERLRNITLSPTDTKGTNTDAKGTKASLVIAPLSRAAKPGAAVSLRLATNEANNPSSSLRTTLPTLLRADEVAELHRCANNEFLLNCDPSNGDGDKYVWVYILVGSVVGVAFIGLIIWCCLRRRERKRANIQGILDDHSAYTSF